jgi:hypothetical protein
MTPRSVMLLLIGFMAGLSISFLRMSVSTWGSAVGFRLPRNYGPGKATSSSSSASAGSMRAGSSGAGGAGAGGRSTAAGGAATTTTKGSSGGAPPSTVVTAARAGTSPVDGLLPPPVREFPKVCNNSAPMTEGPRDWHILSQSELDGSTYPCYWTNLTHWQLAHYHKVGPIKMCTHNPEVDTVISSHLHKYGAFLLLFRSQREGVRARRSHLPQTQSARRRVSEAAADPHILARPNTSSPLPYSTLGPSPQASGARPTSS